MMFTEILLVDDDLVANYLHKALLEEMGIARRVVLQPDARQALAYLRERCFLDEGFRKETCPELLLLDVKMPDWDGFDFLDEVAQRAPAFRQHCPVILLTRSISLG